MSSRYDSRRRDYDRGDHDRDRDRGQRYGDRPPHRDRREGRSRSRSPRRGGPDRDRERRPTGMLLQLSIPALLSLTCCSLQTAGTLEGTTVETGTETTETTGDETTATGIGTEENRTVMTEESFQEGTQTENVTGYTVQVTPVWTLLTDPKVEENLRVVIMAINTHQPVRSVHDNAVTI